MTVSDHGKENMSSAKNQAPKSATVSAWERVELARSDLRPQALDFISLLFEDFIELHGDRTFGDDPAIVTGIGRFHGETVFVVAQQKGKNTEERVQRHFGMPHPEGYRKALRMYDMAGRLRFPIITFVDTPAAHPGIEAEERGQGFAIAQNLLAAMSCPAPIFSVVLSEGGSGGALAIAVADWLAMFENAVYMICPPERCAEILWRDVNKKQLAAAALRVSAHELHEFGIVDNVLPEPPGGSQHDVHAAAETLGAEIAWFLVGCRKGIWTVEKRRERVRRIGTWLENGKT